MGRKTEASPLDALLYHDRTMCIGLVLHLTGRAPTPDRLASHVRDRLDRLPALSVIVSGSGTAATWLRRSPELGYHVRSRDLSAGADIYDVVRELHREPFAEGRPPWTMTILDGHIPGEYLIFYRVSHGVQDIGGITRTLEILFGDASIDSADSDAAVRSLVEPPRPRLRHYLYAVRLVAGASSKTALWPHPVHGYSGLRSLEWAEVPTNTLRSLAGPHGGSTNDAYLSSLARVISQWAARHHPNSDGHDIPISLAINNRRPADVSAPGNQFAVGRMTLPGDNVPLAQGTRMTAVRTAPLKQGQYREAIRRLAASVPRLVMERAFRSALSPARACVLSSHFVIRRPLAFAGDPVHAIDPVTALPVGAPVSILLITYQKVSRAVFVTDSIVPGLENLHEMWHAEVSAGR